MAVKTIIFDLDGTLLNTLEDLTDAVNHSLREYGLPTLSYEAVRMMVGNGVRNLVIRAVEQSSRLAAELATTGSWDPLHRKEGSLDDIFACFKAFYVAHCQVKTRLYDGIRDLLAELHGRGYRIVIVSNKLQAGVTELQRAYFEGIVDVAVGECEGVRRKPAPDMIDISLRKLYGADASLAALKKECIYVGDSDVDILTAENAGMPCISVLWGFRDEAFLRAHGATLFAREPRDILALLSY